MAAKKKAAKKSANRTVADPTATTNVARTRRQEAPHPMTERSPADTVTFADLLQLGLITSPKPVK